VRRIPSYCADVPRIAQLVASVGLVGLVASPGIASAQPASAAYAFSCDQGSLSADFASRDALTQSETPPADWYRTNAAGRYLNDGWGPAASALPVPVVPSNAGCDASTWMRERILTVAMRYIYSPDNPLGLQYRHHHIPGWNPPASTYAGAPEQNPDTDAPGELTAWDAGQGLDCSNFTAWVYNYGLGIKFSGDVGQQFAGTAGPMGQQIPQQGPFQPGDLVFLHPDRNATEASHVVIYVDDDHVIDSRINAQDVVGVQIRQREGWYREAVLGAWRPIG
jgi:hypothetical protein